MNLCKVFREQNINALWKGVKGAIWITMKHKSSLMMIRVECRTRKMNFWIINSSRVSDDIHVIPYTPLFASSIWCLLFMLGNFIHLHYTAPLLIPCLDMFDKLNIMFQNTNKFRFPFFFVSQKRNLERKQFSCRFFLSLPLRFLNAVRVRDRHE